MAVLLAAGLVALGTMGADGCDTSGESGNGQIDPTPEKLDGSSSQEFEAEDIEQAESASQEVQEYCDGAVSEAQRIGCLSHVDESDIP
jgi:hypothetical protein